MKHSEVELRPTSCNEVVLDLLVLAEPLAKAYRVKLALDLADGLPAIQADSLHLQLLLHNVICNAIDAIAENP